MPGVKVIAIIGALAAVPLLLGQRVFSATHGAPNYLP